MAAAIIYGQESRLLPWAAERIGVERFRRDAYCIGLERRGEVVAVVVFDDFTRVSCCMSVASDGSAHWLSRGFLAAVFAYVFVQLGNLRVTSLISEKNLASLRFCQHIGFSIEGRMRNAIALGEDVIVLGLLANDCIFIQPRSIGHDSEKQNSYQSHRGAG